MTYERLIELALAYETGEQVKASGADIVLVAHWLKDTIDELGQAKAELETARQTIMFFTQAINILVRQQNAQKAAG